MLVVLQLSLHARFTERNDTRLQRFAQRCGQVAFRPTREGAPA
jgi:hypothetical protein